MLAHLMLYLGAAIVILWGVIHLIPTRAVVDGFGPISLDNRRIITMEWATEGLMLIFVGMLVLFSTLLGGTQEPVALLVYRASAGVLAVLALWTALTGARTRFVWFKVCPFLLSSSALLFLVASLL